MKEKRQGVVMKKECLWFCAVACRVGPKSYPRRIEVTAEPLPGRSHLTRRRLLPDVLVAVECLVPPGGCKDLLHAIHPLTSDAPGQNPRTLPEPPELTTREL